MVAGVVFVLLAIDWTRPPDKQWTAKALLAGIDLYQTHLSPGLQSAGVRCRFSPSCSHYGRGAIRSKGALGGGLRTAWRIARCGPWTPTGTVDPPPDEPPDTTREPAPKMLH
ncbi:MAG: membrane protein insertion efficiency factor YidD [Thermoanaerobaculia bacterium]|nr:membrane protein insertion efficiency factor YidD [Thermoanaerobaculia bacterium]